MIGRNCHHNVIIDEYDPNGMVIKNQWLKWLIQLESIEKYCNLNLESIEILNILKVFWNSWNLADLLNFLLNLDGLLKIFVRVYWNLDHSRVYWILRVYWKFREHVEGILKFEKLDGILNLEGLLKFEILKLLFPNPFLLHFPSKNNKKLSNFSGASRRIYPHQLTREVDFQFPMP